MLRRSFLSFVAAIPPSVALASPRSQSKTEGVVNRSVPTPSFPPGCFRITFGIHDTTPRAWDGEIMEGQGRYQVVADHFRVNDYREQTFSEQGIVQVKLGNAPFPNDFVRTATSWTCSTRKASLHGPTTEWHMRAEQPKYDPIQSPSILVYQEKPTSEPIHIKTVQGEFSFHPEQIRPFQPALFLNESVQVEYVPPASLLSAEPLYQQDFPAILASGDSLWTAWQEYDGQSDSVLVRNSIQGRWRPASVLIGKSEVFGVALGRDNRGRTWAVWSMKANGTWDLYGQVCEGQNWSSMQKLTDDPAPDAYHRLVTDSTGRLWLVWQRNSSTSQILAKYFNGQEWSREQKVSDGISAQGNNWWPAVAAGPEGSIVVAWDGYALGSYDIYLRRFESDGWRPVEIVAGGPKFQGHPTVATEKTGRIWLAWDESGADWGKDVGFLVPHQATSLHRSRAVQILCLDGNQRKSTPDPLSRVLSPSEFWELPHLQLDADGHPWLFVRHLLMRQPDTPLEGPIDLGLWEIYATRYDGSKWQDLMRLPYSTGRNDMLPSSSLDSRGNLWTAWATDNSSPKSFEPHQLQVRVATFPRLTLSEPIKLELSASEDIPPVRLHQQEADQVKRIRAYRVEHHGKSYRIYRGDFHRHTDISIDGKNDGSLLDAYRYARDAASLDFIGVSNHVDNIWHSYNWWHTQRMADLFHITGSFTAFYGQERSVEYPNGHRNVFYPKRGEQVTPALEAERLGWEGTEGLFAYLRAENGFSIPHTTGRTSGTDWRDNDPKVDNLVEIYQGMRDTYEYPGAPRPFRLWEKWPDPSKPVPRASSLEASPSFRRLGFVCNALAKGYKYGFISSSDHISTHVSYACILAENLTLKSLLEAIRARRTYAATDNIILDVKFYGSNGEHLMGEEFTSTEPIRISAKILGTGAVQQIDVIKDGEIVHTLRPSQAEFEFEFSDNKIGVGESYYYVRVIQKNGEMAWGSPAWVTYSKS